MLEPYRTGGIVKTALFLPGQNDVQISAYGTGLNNAGVIVGYQLSTIYPAVYGHYVSLLRDPAGVYSETVCPQIPPHTKLLPYAINDPGVIAGDDTALSPTHAVIATPLPGSAQFTASASSLTFAPQSVGTTSPGQQVTITNTGNARMDIAGMAFLGSPFGRSEFTVSGCLDTTTGFASLNPGASCTITIYLAPAVAVGDPNGPHAPPPGTIFTDTLFIDDSSPASPHSVNVAGQILAPPPPPPQPTPPSCTMSGYSAGPPRQVTFTMQDTVSGLSNVAVADAANATAAIPSFPAGDTDPLNATMMQTDSRQVSSITLQVTNTAGLSTSCSGGIAGGANQWSGLTGAITGRVAVVPDLAGIFEAFARGSDNSLWHASQTQVNGPWSAWESLGGVITSDPAAIVGSDGGFKVFAAGADSAVWELAQTEPQGAWSNWVSLGGVFGGGPAVALSGGEAIDVFARGTDLALWHRYQMGLDGPWSDWTSLGGYVVSDPVVAQTYSAAPINVFAQGGDNALWQIAETDSATEMWTGWNPVGGDSFTGRASFAVDQGGSLEIFARGADNTLRRNVQSATDPLMWTGWTPLGGYLTSEPAAATNQDGSIDVFVRGGDNALWHIAQGSPGPSFGAWTSLGGILGSTLTALPNSDGRLEVYALAPDSTLWHIAQVFPGAWN
jgi:hypothetical protein